MALAAALAATGARPASFLPTITCSSCAQEIEIAAMGEHICTPEIAAPAEHKSSTSSMGNPFKLREYGASGHGGASLAQTENVGIGSNQRSTKPPRIALAKINSDVANRAFLAPRDPGLELPLTPAASGRSGSSGGKFPHSMTSPNPRLHEQRPPSPELTANLDSAFPLFPTQAVASGRSTPSNGRETPTGSDRAPSRAASRAQNLEPAPTFAEPRSPGLVLQKFETLRTGPFAARRQGSGDSKEDADALDERPPSRAAAEERLAPSDTWNARSITQRLDTASAVRPVPQASEVAKRTPPRRPARLSYEQLSPVLLERFSAGPDNMWASQSELANNTYTSSAERSDKHTPSQSISQMHSEPAFRLPERKASLANLDLTQTPTIPELSAVLPKRSSSRVGTRMDYRMENAPPVPRPVQQHRNYSSHTPSESGSSIVSSANTYSSGPSPISSAASSVDPFSPLSSALSGHEEDEQLRSTGVSVRNQQKPGLRAELPSSRSPPRKFGRPAPLTENSSKVDRVHVAPMESPMDPALRLGALHGTRQPLTPDTARNGPLPAQPASQAGPLELTHSPTINTYDTSPRDGPRLSPYAASAPQRPSRPTTAKPVCRGCGFVIEGKSVKAADGRLTGRWHKSCFVCTSCEKPFATADFYVLRNQPFCEHHYHEQNGSLCHGCHRGIEGQYLETTSTTLHGTTEKKFHPRCFTCATCHEVLSEEYFEVSGMGALCERHALATLRQQQIRQGSRSNPLNRRDMFAERRTTRLINPMMG